ncbi:hypothetical protein HDU81_008426 [Chytriomyces hyalinus]|nr:hypothetical protein HDU81_008426 [Chytriomyces hyalinus]
METKQQKPFLVSNTVDLAPMDRKSTSASFYRNRCKWISLVLLTAALSLTVFLIHPRQASQAMLDTPRPLTNTSLATTFPYRPFSGKAGAVVYYTNWARYSRGTVDTINFAGISAVNYAFYFVDKDGVVTSSDSWADSLNLPALRAQRINYPQLRTVAAIGGWTGSGHFSEVAASSVARTAFANNVLNLLDTEGFDGVDLDWEYPGGSGGLWSNSKSAYDAQNFVLLLKELRTKLGASRQISIAVGSSRTPYGAYLTQIAQQVSYMNVMSYDFNGPWTKYSDLNAALNLDSRLTNPNPNKITISSVLNSYVQAGVPKLKLVPGIAFYGRSWQVNSPLSNNGLYQACSSTVNPASAVGACFAIMGDVDDVPYTDNAGVKIYSGIWSYRNLRSQTNSPLLGPTTPRSGWARRYFSILEAATLSSGTTTAKKFISYEDPTSVQAKAYWSKVQGYGGMMVWEISFDYQQELTNALLRGWNA